MVAGHDAPPARAYEVFTATSKVVYSQQPPRSLDERHLPVLEKDISTGSAHLHSAEGSKEKVHVQQI